MTEFVNLFTATPPPPPLSPFGSTADQEKIFGEQRSTDWTIPEAFLALILAAVSADGKVSPEEHSAVMALSMRSRALKSLGPQKLAEINTIVSQRLQQRPNALQEACQSLPTDMRLTVFAHCMDLVLADGDYAQQEAEFLNKITTYLALDHQKAELVQQVMLIKNRF